MPISSNPVFFLSVYSSYIHLYLFLPLVYPPLFLYISLSIQIDVYLFQPHFLHLSLISIYPPISSFIFFLSTTISFYPLFIQIYTDLFQSPFSNLSLSLVYWPIYFSIFLPIKFTAISFNVIFLISIYISHLFTFITFYLLYASFSIQVHTYIFQPISLLVVRSSNLVDTVSLITNNYFYLSNRKKIENSTANIQVINRNR